MRLYGQTGNNKSFVPTASDKDITSKTFTPTNDQYIAYKADLGKKNSDAGTSFIKSDVYKNMSDEEKESYLQDVYSGMKALAKESALPGYTSDDKIAAAYKDGGSKEMIDYLTEKYAFDKAGVTMSDATNKIYQDGGVDALNKYAQSKNTLESLGLTNNDSNRSLLDDNGEDYMKTYAALDSIAKSDKNNKTKDGSDTSFAGSTLTEQLSYIKQANLSDDDAGKVLYNGMSDDEKEKLSTLHDSYGDKGIYQFEQTKIKADTDNSGSVSVK